MFFFSFVFTARAAHMIFNFYRIVSKNEDLFLVTVIPYVHPLIRTRPNWTMDSDEFRSRTDPNSSVQNLLDSRHRFKIDTHICCVLFKLPPEHIGVQH